MVCFRNVSVNTLHKGDDDDDNKDTKNKNKNKKKNNNNLIIVSATEERLPIVVVYGSSLDVFKATVCIKITYFVLNYANKCTCIYIRNFSIALSGKMLLN
jgi:hypothetical protein